MQHPHRRWEGFGGHPWVSGPPEPERARGPELADKAANGEKTLKPLRGGTRVLWRQLDCPQSNAVRGTGGPLVIASDSQMAPERERGFLYLKEWAHV